MSSRGPPGSATLGAPVTPPRLLLTCVLLLVLAACGGEADDVPPAAQATTQPAAEATTEAAAEVTYEYHDEFGHGHCYLTALGDGEEVVVCIAPTDAGSRIACFTREEAQSTRNAKGLLRLDRQGEVKKQEEWPAECADALAVAAPGTDASGAGGY